MPWEDEKIIIALRDKRWDYRTADGIAKETGVSIDRVLAFLESRKDIVLKASLPDRLGFGRESRLGKPAKADNSAVFVGSCLHC